MPSAAQFSRKEDFGRFGDSEEELTANPLDFNDDLGRAELPKTPPPLQIRRDMVGQQGIGQNTPISNSPYASAQSQAYSSPQASSLQNIGKSVGFPESNSNISDRVADAVPNQGRDSTYTEKRLFDEIEDIRAQNNEILRRIQRLESKIR